MSSTDAHHTTRPRAPDLHTPYLFSQKLGQRDAGTKYKREVTAYTPPISLHGELALDCELTDNDSVARESLGEEMLDELQSATFHAATSVALRRPPAKPLPSHKTSNHLATPPSSPPIEHSTGTFQTSYAPVAEQGRLYFHDNVDLRATVNGLGASAGQPLPPSEMTTSSPRQKRIVSAGIAKRIQTLARRSGTKSISQPYWLAPARPLAPRSPSKVSMLKHRKLPSTYRLRQPQRSTAAWNEGGRGSYHSRSSSSRTLASDRSVSTWQPRHRRHFGYSTSSSIYTPTRRSYREPDRSAHASFSVYDPKTPVTSPIKPLRLPTEPTPSNIDELEAELRRLLHFDVNAGSDAISGPSREGHSRSSTAGSSSLVSLGRRERGQRVRHKRTKSSKGSVVSNEVMEEPSRVVQAERCTPRDKSAAASMPSNAFIIPERKSSKAWCAQVGPRKKVSTPGPDDFPKPPKSKTVAPAISSSRDPTLTRTKHASVPAEGQRRRRQKSIKVSSMSAPLSLLSSEPSVPAHTSRDICAQGKPLGETASSDLITTSMPPGTFVGAVNVQLPNTFVWKRRWLSVDNEGYVVFSNPFANPKDIIANLWKKQLGKPQTSYYQGWYQEKYHITSFTLPCRPHPEQTSLPHSVALCSAANGTILHIACEDEGMTKRALRALKAYSRAWEEI